MKHIKFYSLLSLILFLFSGIMAQEEVRKPYTLTHHLSEAEKALFHTLGKDFVATDPPPGEVHNIAEFEQMEGVLVGYPGSFGIPYDLIAAMSEETNVTTVVENNNQLNYVTNQYQNNGVNMANATFIVTALDSYWTRDYGPWYIRYGDDQIGIMDFIYNRPNRPNDNAIPEQMATYLGIESFAMDLIHAGGNYMTDGYGISSSSDLVEAENPDLTPEDIDQMVLDYLGINTYHVLPDPNNTYIDHIDCWGKFLDVDKVLIREVPASHPQYDEIEATAAYYAAQPSAWGNNFEVYRVWTPNNEPYTNSLILNDRVFLPIMGGPWDDEAVAAYEEAMPGYEILTFTGSWESTDALHCRTKGIADRNTFYIDHIPLLGEQDVLTEYPIEATVTAYSGETIGADDVVLHYWINGEEQTPIPMTDEGDKLYTAVIPAGPEGSEMAYYITGVDQLGNTGNHPFIGEADPHIFYVGEQLFAGLNLDVTEINAWVNQGDTDIETFTLSSTGGLPLNYSIEYSAAVMEDYEYDVEDSPNMNSWNSNTFTEEGWTEFEVTGVIGEIANWTIDFTWDTDQYYYESTFLAESPAGTQATIAAGIGDGTYSISLSSFNGEQMQGTWKLWIIDSYGDGGHQATDITVTITKTYVIYPWLTVTPESGSVDPGNSEMITVTCDGSSLPLGDYEGSITITSNDPDYAETIIPVYFHVDFASGVEARDQNTLVNNYPNPFAGTTYFEINGQTDGEVSLEIFSQQGESVFHTSETLSSETNTIEWQAGEELPQGIYFYQIKLNGKTETGKLILR